jgi:hypothetical protein
MLMLLRSRDSSLKEMKSDAFASFIPRSHRTTKTQKKRQRGISAAFITLIRLREVSEHVQYF